MVRAAEGCGTIFERTNSILHSLRIDQDLIEVCLRTESNLSFDILD